MGTHLIYGNTETVDYSIHDAAARVVQGQGRQRLQVPQNSDPTLVVQGKQRLATRSRKNKSQMDFACFTSLGARHTAIALCFYYTCIQRVWYVDEILQK